MKGLGKIALNSPVVVQTIASLFDPMLGDTEPEIRTQIAGLCPFYNRIAFFDVKRDDWGP